jgi:hypothetical protein
MHRNCPATDADVHLSGRQADGRLDIPVKLGAISISDAERSHFAWTARRLHRGI